MIRDIALTLLSRVSTILALLLCTPFFFRILGAERYSLIAVSLIAHSLSGLVDAGLSPLAAAALARSGEVGSSRITVLSEIYTQSLRRVVPLYLASLVVMSAYNIAWGGALGLRALGVVQLNSVMFADVFLLVIFRINYACLQGLGKHMTANGLYAATLGVRALLGVAAVLIFRSAESVFAAQAAGSAVGIALAMWFLRFPVGQFHRLTVKSSIWAKAVTQSIDTGALRNLWIISFCASVTSVLPQLLVKFAGSPAELSRFSLAGSLANALLAFQMAYQSVLLPQFARAAKTNGSPFPSSLSLSAIAGALVIALICGAAYVAADDLIALWLGDFDPTRLAAIATLMRLQLISVSFLGATAVPYVLCIVTGRTQPQLYASLLYFVIVLTAAPLAYRLDGSEGVALASTISTGIFCIIYIFAAEVSNGRVRWIRVMRWAILPLFAGAVPGTIVMLVCGAEPPASYPAALMNLAVRGCLYTILASAVALCAYLWRPLIRGRGK